MVKWLRICLPMQGTPVQSLAGELKSHVLLASEMEAHRHLMLPNGRSQYTHEVVVPKKFNLNMIRALHPITNLQGKEKKNQRLEKHIQWHHGNTVSTIQIVDK